MEELLASQSKHLITLHRGQPVEGEIVGITEKELTLDLGSKSEGVISTRDIPDSQLKDLKIGSKLKAFVYMVENEYGQTVLSSSPQNKISTTPFKGHGINWPKFQMAQSQKSKLQGKVNEVNRGGLIVEVMGARGFLPNSQVGFELLSKSGAGMEELIGQDLTVTVIEIDQANNKLIFSQRGQISPEVKEKLSSFKKDQKVPGKIVAILPFGLVVDVAGAEGLVFISDASWDKIPDLSKAYSVGQELEVLVLGLDEELGRLNLSIKQLSEDPFEKLAKNYPADEVVKATVVSVSEAGVVVQLEDGVEGFLPASKMTPGSTYEAGKTVTLLVDGVDAQRRRINLAPFVTSTAGLIYK
ncbi:S1 RNA-binding domain-containing protein [Patescibacteria group bacterium]|nr:S1 RNA-binding domain-containing protein [Patescibacteria group bacterium]